MKRILTYLLSFYMLLLLATPCIDAPLANTSAQTEYAQSIPANHQHHADECSPFCTCQCCSSPLTFHTNAKIVTVHRVATTLYCANVIQNLSSYSEPIWQPPILA